MSSLSGRHRRCISGYLWHWNWQFFQVFSTKPEQSFNGRQARLGGGMPLPETQKTDRIHPKFSFYWNSMPPYVSPIAVASSLGVAFYVTPPASKCETKYSTAVETSHSRQDKQCLWRLNVNQGFPQIAGKSWKIVPYIHCTIRFDTSEVNFKNPYPQIF